MGQQNIVNEQEKNQNTNVQQKLENMNQDTSVVQNDKIIIEKNELKQYDIVSSQESKIVIQPTIPKNQTYDQQNIFNEQEKKQNTNVQQELENTNQATTL